MPKRRAQKRRRRTKPVRPIPTEWIGGVFTFPFFVSDPDDGDEPVRPLFVVWMEAGTELIVGQKMIDPGEVAGAVARVLRDAIERPFAGAPRRPGRVRVADPALAAELRSALGPTLRIDVAPTPELDELFELMVESLAGDGSEASYLEGGRIPSAAVADLFGAAEALYRMAPWDVVTDDQALRVDIPALGIDGACVSIIGSLGESFGVLVFPSLVALDAFVLATDDLEVGGGCDFGTGWLALSFEHADEVSAGMRREVADHGWPVADAGAYPVVVRCERDGMPHPLTERDVETATACAFSLAAFFEAHLDLFATDEVEPVSVSYFDHRDVEVRLTAPYEAFELFEADEPTVQPRLQPQEPGKVGRNDACPCGSGRKYKKCHLAADRAERAPQRQAQQIHELDHRLEHELIPYAMTLGVEWERHTRDFRDYEDVIQLAGPWSIYGYHVDGRTVVDRYLERHRERLSRAERDWLDAQQAAWLSVWEVTATEPGQSMTLRDLLSDEERCVSEARGSRLLVVRDTLLGRVVDCGGVSVISGMHPRPLSPTPAAEVVRRARGRLRRKRAVPVERLRDEAFGRYLIKRWEDQVAALDWQAANPPDLQNTDGDPILLTSDHFALATGAHAEVEARLTALEGVEGPQPDSEDVFVFFAPCEPRASGSRRTIVGSADLTETGLRVQTNSLGRADALRARIEEACGDLLRHRLRDHSDPLSSAARDGDDDWRPESPPPEVAGQLREFLRAYYDDWMDESVPALGGRSPREAMGTAQGRAAVDVLLKDMENQERRAKGADAFSFAEVRRKLGLDG